MRTVTTLLDIGGVGLVVAGVALLVSVPAALVVAGIAVLLLSWRLS